LVVGKVSYDLSNCARFLFNSPAAKLPIEQNAPTVALRCIPALITCQEAHQSLTRAP